MKVLIVEDEAISLLEMQEMVSKWGYSVVIAANGLEGWEILSREEPPMLIILDWMMPKMDGLTLLRKLRERGPDKFAYVLMVTARSTKKDRMESFLTGADDFITKPFDPEELRAKLNVGERLMRLQSELAFRVRQLEAALSQVKQLEGLFPICTYCKKIRDDQNYWHQIDEYISQHSQRNVQSWYLPSLLRRICETGSG